MLHSDDPRLTAFALGELDPSEMTEMAAAVASSTELTAVVDEIRAAATALQAGFDAEWHPLTPSRATSPLQLPLPLPLVSETQPLATVAERVSPSLIAGKHLGSSSGNTRSMRAETSRINWTAWGLTACLLIGAVGFAVFSPNFREASRVASNDGNDSDIELSIAQPVNSAANASGQSLSALAPPENADVEAMALTLSANAKQEMSEERRLQELTRLVAPSGTREIVLGKENLGEAQPHGVAPFRGHSLLADQFGDNNGNRMFSSNTRESGRQWKSTQDLDVRELEEHESFSILGEQVVDAESEREKNSDRGTERFDEIFENEFQRARTSPLSTLSIDVDTASYSKVRMYLQESHQLPPRNAVRIEELVNYFDYRYAPPTDDAPFAVHQAVTACPWSPEHRLVRVALKGRDVAKESQPQSNLVFLLDVSGSMDEPNRLPLVKRGIEMLVARLGENDRVAIVVYAGAAGVVLESTNASRKELILDKLDQLKAGGSTNGGDGIRMAYQIARENFVPGGINRVVLCTDGDFNVGTTGTPELVGLVESQARSNVFLTVLGFGMGNLNDSLLEQITNKGNGYYAFIDSDAEARKVLVQQRAGTLETIAKDVKIQIEFNPAKVGAWRLIGYENRLMAAEDFQNDRKDAGEIGTGHTVTALYEVIPTEYLTAQSREQDKLKYQPDANPVEKTSPPEPVDASGELLTLSLRFKQPEGDTSRLLTFPLRDSGQAFSSADSDFQFAAAVAAFGMKLRGSVYSGSATWSSIHEMAGASLGDDLYGYRTEFLSLIRVAEQLSESGR